jgi:serine protease Do
LKPILDGKPPKQVQQLQAMQDRIQAIAEQIVKSTVHVRIGANHGSGVIISEDGYILTAAHVIAKSNRPTTVILHDGSHVIARTRGLNFDRDAGLIKLEADRKWPHLPLGDSDKLRDGQWCLATGHPGGWQLARGPVVRLGRLLSVSRRELRTDCQLTGGDSGGPLVDLAGNVIGIHSRIGTNLSSNLHVPIGAFRKDWQRLVDAETWGVLEGFHPFIGVQAARGVEDAAIAFVRPGSPADVAGIRKDDLVIRFDGQAVRTFAELQELVRESSPGQEVAVAVKRGNETLKLLVEIGQHSG